jgi:pimeloyl-ACP methyl ester carboxylesterase
MIETTGAVESMGVRIAWRRVPGRGRPLVWLGGFRSEMTGSKAETLARWAAATGRDFVRFDYSGHGQSGGRFEEGTITRWRADTLAVLDALAPGPSILIGSSMGGWLACLAAMARPERVKALVLIAPAADFTERLLKPSLSPEALAVLAREGLWRRPSAYDPKGDPITAALLEDGARWSILPGPVAVEAPVRILQGGADTDVPWRHALDLALAIQGPDVIFTLIRDGDHRLSRESDLESLVAAAEEVCARVGE